MKKLLFILLTILLTSCYSAKHEDIEQVKIGMSVEEATKLMSIEIDEWDIYNGDGEYKYAAIYASPGGHKRTFWIVVKDSVVINSYGI